MQLSSRSETELRLHATAVAFEGRAVLLTGPSGSGKSSLALELMSRGGALVGDDRVILRRVGGSLVVLPEPNLRGMIEARGIGILGAEWIEHATVMAKVDLAAEESQRLPERASEEFLGISVPVLKKASGPLFAAALRQYILHGRKE